MVGNVSTVSILHRNDFIDFGSVAVSIMEILDYLDINTCWFFLPNSSSALFLSVVSFSSEIVCVFLLFVIPYVIVI